ncbi:MAG TPA: hypothetical protein VG734_16830 [Lacunisphaera sp.]|nr:hypothetical protein [Lacunisphaera sp.]
MKTTPLLAALVALALAPIVRATPVDFAFASTSDPLAWLVSYHMTATDTGNDPSRFLTGAGDFAPAVSVPGRGDYIANNSSGTNGWIGAYTQFVFRQTFDLTGYNPTTVHLVFQWAADDTGQGFADRGSWLNRFTLNGSGFLGIDSCGYYDYDPNKIVDLSSGFVAGLNTIDFYVQGNGVTDGFELRRLSATAEIGGPTEPTVPDQGSDLLMTLFGIVALVLFWHLRKSRRKPR